MNKGEKGVGRTPLEKRFITPTADWGDITCCLVYPNTYRAGMSSLGFQTLYRLLNSAPGVTCDRAFLPGRKAKTAGIKSFEKNRRLSEFDILAFSISFENDYLNVVTLLKEAGIPLRSSDRNQSHPLVTAGGVACFLNPEPLAPFIDCFLLGEAEPFIHRFLDICREQGTREDLLGKMAADLPYAYIPRFYTPGPVNRNGLELWVPAYDFAPPRILTGKSDLDTIQTTSAVISSDTEFKNVFLIETGRGCPHGCRFCTAGFLYRPPRFYPENTITRAMAQAAEKTDRIGLVSTAVSDHPGVNRICQQAVANNLMLSFSSFRADRLDEGLVKRLGETSVKTAAIAPEAGSERMRAIINKQITEDDILNCTALLVNAGVMNLKLYFMVGLPYEEMTDVTGIVALVKRIKAVFLESARKKKKIGEITVSVNPFVPKPVTPFQWVSFADDNELKEKFAIIRNGLKGLPNIKANFDSIRSCRINALLSRADRHGARIIEKALSSGWTAALRHHADYIRKVLYQQWDTKDILPWDIVDTNIKKTYLEREFTRAQKARTTPPCPMTPCEQCGICMEND